MDTVLFYVCCALVGVVVGFVLFSIGDAVDECAEEYWSDYDE